MKILDTEINSLVLVSFGVFVALLILGIAPDVGSMTDGEPAPKTIGLMVGAFLLFWAAFGFFTTFEDSATINVGATVISLIIIVGYSLVVVLSGNNEPHLLTLGSFIWFITTCIFIPFILGFLSGSVSPIITINIWYKMTWGEWSKTAKK